MRNSLQDTWCDTATDRTAGQRAVNAGIRSETMPLSHLGNTATTIGKHKKILCPAAAVKQFYSLCNQPITIKLAHHYLLITTETLKKGNAVLSVSPRNHHITHSHVLSVFQSTQPIMKEL